MNLLDIYKAKTLGINKESLFASLLGSKMSAPYELITEKVPYVLRKTANGINVGNKCKDTIVGGTLGWNQAIPSSNFTYEPSPANAVVSYDSETDTTSYSATIGSQGWGYAAQAMIPVVNNHIYYLSATLKAKSGITYIWLKPTNSGATPVGYSDPTPGVYGAIQKAVTSDGETTTLLGVSAPSGTAVTAQFTNVFMVDLTKLFGETIANHIYAIEQAKAFTGVAFVKALFAESYYSPASESLESVNVSSKITKDVNGNVIGNYALDSSLVLRGIPKLDANNKLYYDGDVYESDGTVTRLYGTRAYQSGDTTNGSTMITDGTNTVYKLDTPIKETAQPFTNPQSVMSDGDEEYVDYSVLHGVRDVSIPCGHSTEYKVYI